MNLTPEDRQRIIQALRAAAYRAEMDSLSQTNPKIKEAFLAEARRYLELAERVQQAAPPSAAL
jgi:hypothetical protein